MTETLDVLGAPMIVKRDAGLFFAEHPIPPGYFVPPHRHADDEEMLYVMEGELTLIVRRVRPRRRREAAFTSRRACCTAFATTPPAR